MEKGTHTPCPGCPPLRLGVLQPLVDGPAGCVFVGHRVASRDPLPARWFEEFDFGVVRNGVVIRERFNHGGGCTAVDVSGSGGFIPLPLGKEGAPAHSAYAASDLSICLMTRAAFEQHEDGTCYRDLHVLEAHALDRIERLMDARGRPTASAQVAALLCALSDTLCPGRTRIIMPPELRRTDMAALLGVRRETFSRQLGRLATMGAIRRGPEGLQILDRASLEQVASRADG